eukprot:g42129.t1
MAGLGEGYNPYAQLPVEKSPARKQPERSFFGFLSPSKQATSSRDASPAKQTHVPVELYRRELEDFYKKHNPGKLSSIDRTLQQYQGREPELMRKLFKKYQVSPPDPGKAQGRRSLFRSSNSPSRIPIPAPLDAALPLLTDPNANVPLVEAGGAFAMSSGLLVARDGQVPKALDMLQGERLPSSPVALADALEQERQLAALTEEKQARGEEDSEEEMYDSNGHSNSRKPEESEDEEIDSNRETRASSAGSLPLAPASLLSEPVSPLSPSPPASLLASSVSPSPNSLLASLSLPLPAPVPLDGWSSASPSSSAAPPQPNGVHRQPDVSLPTDGGVSAAAPAIELDENKTRERQQGRGGSGEPARLGTAAGRTGRPAAGYGGAGYGYGYGGYGAVSVWTPRQDQWEPQCACSPGIMIPFFLLPLAFLLLTPLCLYVAYLLTGANADRWDSVIRNTRAEKTDLVFSLCTMAGAGSLCLLPVFALLRHLLLLCRVRNTPAFPLPPPHVPPLEPSLPLPSVVPLPASLNAPVTPDGSADARSPMFDGVLAHRWRVSLARVLVSSVSIGANAWVSLPSYALLYADVLNLGLTMLEAYLLATGPTLCCWRAWKSTLPPAYPAALEILSALCIFAAVGSFLRLLGLWALMLLGLWALMLLQASSHLLAIDTFLVCIIYITYAVYVNNAIFVG